MSDVADSANKVADLQRSIAINKAKVEAGKFELGQAGDCDGCDKHFPRVVPRKGGYFCGKCRDELKLG